MLNRVLLPCFLAVGAKALSCSEPATVTVTFKDTWCAASHPNDFAASVGISGPFPPAAGAHISPIVGVSHSSDPALWATGAIASAGVCAIATTGSPSVANTDIALAKTVGTILDSVQGAAKPSCGAENATPEILTQTFTLNVDQTHPYVSFITMLAPSPDWFTGVPTLNLCENGQWTSKVINAGPYDAGCDSGTTFITDNVPTLPQDPISFFTASANGPFANSGTISPVATFNFGSFVSTASLLAPPASPPAGSECGRSVSPSACRPNDPKMATLTTAQSQGIIAGGLALLVLLCWCTVDTKGFAVIGNILCCSGCKAFTGAK